MTRPSGKEGTINCWRVNDMLVSMEDKGLVKRGGSVRSGGRPSTTWVIA